MDTTDHTCLTVGIVLFDDVEVLDFAGPFEVFSVAGEVTKGAFRVLTVAERATPDQPVIARNGLKIIPDFVLMDAPYLDILVVPGGYGTRREVHNATLIGWLNERAAKASLTTSVCTGAFLLAEAGLLIGKAATTHWQSIARLSENYPATEVRTHTRFVDEGDIVSSAGVSAGIDMALYIVERLKGAEVARETAREMEYEWA